MRSAESRIEDCPPLLPDLALHGQDIQVVRQGSDESTQLWVLVQHMLLVDLIDGIRGGEDEHRGAKWPEIQVVIGAQIWIVPPHLVGNIERMGIAGQLGKQARDHEKMSQEEVVRRHWLYRTQLAPKALRMGRRQQVSADSYQALTLELAHKPSS